MKLDSSVLEAIAQAATAFSEALDNKKGKEVDTNLLNEKAKEWREVYAEYKRVDELAKTKHAESELKRYELRDLLEEAGIEKYFVPDLGTVYTQTTTTRSFPKDPEEKQKFFDSVKEKHGEDVLQGLVSVAYQTLNSYCKAEEEGGETKFPGLSEPKNRTDVRFRKG